MKYRNQRALYQIEAVYLETLKDPPQSFWTENNILEMIIQFSSIGKCMLKIILKVKKGYKTCFSVKVQALWFKPENLLVQRENSASSLFCVDPEQATQAQTTVLVVTSGTVKFDGNKQHYFNQNFLLTAQSTPNNTVWKIASDCFRFQDWASSQRGQKSILFWSISSSNRNVWELMRFIVEALRISSC